MQQAKCGAKNSLFNLISETCILYFVGATTEVFALTFSFQAYAAIIHCPVNEKQLNKRCSCCMLLHSFVYFRFRLVFDWLFIHSFNWFVFITVRFSPVKLDFIVLEVPYSGKFSNRFYFCIIWTTNNQTKLTCIRKFPAWLRGLTRLPRSFWHGNSSSTEAFHARRYTWQPLTINSTKNIRK